MDTNVTFVHEKLSYVRLDMLRRMWLLANPLCGAAVGREPPPSLKEAMYARSADAPGCVVGLNPYVPETIVSQLELTGWMRAVQMHLTLYSRFEDSTPLDELPVSLVAEIGWLLVRYAATRRNKPVQQFPFVQLTWPFWVTGTDPIDTRHEHRADLCWSVSPRVFLQTMARFGVVLADQSAASLYHTLFGEELPEATLDLPAPVQHGVELWEPWMNAKETLMSDSAVKTLGQAWVQDIPEAAWRVAGSQLLKSVREPLVGLLARHLAAGDESLRARAALFLQTETGTAILGALLATLLSSLPVEEHGVGDVAARLARELRIRTLTSAGDMLADVVAGPLRAVVATHLQGESIAVTSPPRTLRAREETVSTGTTEAPVTVAVEKP